MLLSTVVCTPSFTNRRTEAGGKHAGPVGADAVPSGLVVVWSGYFAAAQGRWGTGVFKYAVFSTVPYRTHSIDSGIGFVVTCDASLCDPVACGRSTHRNVSSRACYRYQLVPIDRGSVESLIMPHAGDTD